ncbi:MAG: phage holin family protein [Longimicrobiales bacterium]
MATQPQLDPGRRALPPSATPPGEGLGGTLRELAADMGRLVRQEVQLAKLEVGQTLSAATLDAVRVMIALVLAAIGGLCFVIFMILGIGTLLDGAYWAGALITGTLLLLVGGILTFGAVRDLKRRSVKPEQAMDAVREDLRLAKQEAVALKERMKR